MSIHAFSSQYQPSEQLPNRILREKTTPSDDINKHIFRYVLDDKLLSKTPKRISVTATAPRTKKIILLNFEDDTTVPVLEIDKKYMDYILSWYEQCNLILDVESTFIDVPQSITAGNLDTILYKSMNYAHKDEFVNNYIPLIFKNIITNNAIQQLEQKFSLSNVSVAQTSEWSMSSDSIKETYLEEIVTSSPKSDIVGIIVPENIKSDSYKDICINSNTLPVSVQGYNTEIIFNNGLSDFAMNSEVLEETLDCKIKKEGNRILFVLLNVKNVQTLVVENVTDDMIYTINNYPEFGFSRVFGILTNNEEIMQFVRNEFHQIQFNDIDEINKRLSVTSQYIDFSNKYMKGNLATSSEESQVKAYILNCYVISDDLNHKMKSSTLYDAIVNSKCVYIDPGKLNGFKNRLSKYLKDINLNKKRYNDGYYYYGIRIKMDADFNQRLTDTEIKSYIQGRDNII